MVKQHLFWFHFCPEDNFIVCRFLSTTYERRLFHAKNARNKRFKLDEICTQKGAFRYRESNPGLLGESQLS
jgi:hypothetical protein